MKAGGVLKDCAVRSTNTAQSPAISQRFVATLDLRPGQTLPESPSRRRAVACCRKVAPRATPEDGTSTDTFIHSVSGLYIESLIFSNALRLHRAKNLVNRECESTTSFNSAIRTPRKYYCEKEASCCKAHAE